MKTLLLAISLCIVSFGGATAQTQHQPTGISVTGEGLVKVTPDRVNIKARIETRGQSAEEVKASADKVMDAVIDYLKKENVDKKFFRTDYVRIDKKKDYDTKETYYTAEQAISIELQDIKRYDAIMDGLIKLGINRIDGISFESSQLEKYRAEARQKAAQNALTKAQTYAQTLGLKVGKAQMISEVGTPTRNPFYALNSMAARSYKAEADSSQETLAVGQIEITERVQVRFGLNLE